MNLSGMAFIDNGWRLVWNARNLRSDAKRREKMTGYIRIPCQKKGAVFVDNKYYKKVFFDDMDIHSTKG